MTFDAFCLAAVAQELTALRGAFVDQAHQPEPLTVTLTLNVLGGSATENEGEARGSRRHWLFASDAQWARCHAVDRRPPTSGPPPAFAMLLRKHLAGARLTEVEQPAFDRILRLTFRRGEETRVLVHEVMGRNSNLLLLDEADQILGALKTSRHRQDGTRPVFVGAEYHLPPGQRPDPRSFTLEQLRDRLCAAEDPDGLMRRLNGWGLFAAREAFAEGGDLAEAVYARMERVRKGRFNPRVFSAEPGRRAGLWAFPTLQPGFGSGQPHRTMSAACEAFYGEQQEQSQTEALRKSLLGLLSRAQRTAAIQLSEAQAALDGLDKAETLRIQGELLSANASQVERGETSLTLPNWYDPEGGTLTIPLDPELDGRENAERCFHRYRRATASAEAALDRIPHLETRTTTLNDLARRITEAEPEALGGLREELKSKGLFREQAQRPGGKAAPSSEYPAGIRIKRIPVGAWDILYGENATSNDYLTTRVAGPYDLWLHARAITGAHVVIVGVQSLARLPPEVLREAARLAALHSEAKHSSMVAVDYTFRRYVRKPRGSAPGSVHYVRERTLHVEPRS